MIEISSVPLVVVDVFHPKHFAELADTSPPQAEPCPLCGLPPPAASVPYARATRTYRPPACGAYQRRRAACPGAPRAVRTGYACQPRACCAYRVPSHRRSPALGALNGACRMLFALSFLALRTTYFPVVISTQVRIRARVRVRIRRRVKVRVQGEGPGWGEGAWTIHLPRAPQHTRTQMHAHICTCAYAHARVHMHVHPHVRMRMHLLHAHARVHMGRCCLTS